MKRKAFIAVPIILILVSAVSVVLGNNQAQTAPESAKTSVVQPIVPLNADTLFNMVNDERVKAGVKPLVRDTRLDASAKAKCEDMLVNNYWSHTSPSGVEPWYWIQEQHISYKKAAENLAYGFNSDNDTVIGWMNSPGHRENILNVLYTKSGMATCNNSSRALAVQHFIKT